MSSVIDFRHGDARLEGSAVHVVEAGPTSGPSVVFLHGWPQSWRSWRDVMTLAAVDTRVVAVDLPGVGLSNCAVPGGSKREIAARIHALIGELQLTDATLVGHDIGGMVAYACLRRYRDIPRVVIMDTVIPGVDPWSEVLRNPYIWHFAFHAIPELPELLVHGHQSEYFDFFFDVLSVDATSITPQARAEYAAAYHTEAALAAGFDFYRAFTQDAEDNTARASTGSLDTPVLYLRGERESGDIATYAKGLQDAGVANLTTGLIPNAGHFTQEEMPARVWQVIHDFATGPPAHNPEPH